MTDRPPWCDERGPCLRHPDQVHVGCYGHHARTGAPCTRGLGCPWHCSPWGPILEPFGMAFAELEDQYLTRCHTMSDEDLLDLLAACDRLTTTNCWYAAYDARDHVRWAARYVLGRRGRVLLTLLGVQDG